MIGIKNIGIYIPERKIDNLTRLTEFDISEDFVKKKIGIRKISKKEPEESSSDLCVKSFHDLLARENGLTLNQIDCVSVCSQNADYSLPHTSAILQKKLSLPNACAAFDINLGCSGYVYGLSIMKSFMESNDLKFGVLFTSDAYSPIIDHKDRNTELLFGDAATVTLLTENPIFQIKKSVFHTDGHKYDALIKKTHEKLVMKGREIFNFVMKNCPVNIKKCLNANNITQTEIDLFLFHQASKYLIDNLGKRMSIDNIKVPFEIENYGNTVSSSIPIILKDYLFEKKVQTILLSGFGVGLSIASLILRRSK